MQKRIILFVIIMAACAGACTKHDNELFKNQITGDWLVVGNPDFRMESGMVIEWGLFYVGAVGIHSDHSFTINKSDKPVGKWKLAEGLSKIIFYSEINDAGTIYRDTTAFKISLKNDELILKDDVRYFIHKRIP